MNVSESAGGVVLNGDMVLVVSQHGNSWSLPKGRVEAGESYLTAAKREIYEETGLTKITLIKELGIYERCALSRDGLGEDKSKLKIIHIFLFKTNQKIIKPIDPHNPEARWVPKGKVAKLLTAKADKEFFASILDGI